MIYKMFDIYIEINPIYERTRKNLEPFEASENVEPDFFVNISAEEVEKESENDSSFDLPYHEMVCIFRHITDEIIRFDGMFIHSAVLEYKGDGYVFCGLSGAGKTTHASMWKKHFGDEVHIINGDKPIYRFFEDGIYAYGNPWCGKEGYYCNSEVKIKAVYFIVQSKENNNISKINSDIALKKMLNQIVMPKKITDKLKVYEFLDRLLKETEFFELECDISDEAVETAYRAVNQ